MFLDEAALLSAKGTSATTSPNTSTTSTTSTVVLSV